jgi:protein-disulfide isomerase
MCNKQKLCDDNNCEICFNLSFASNPKSEYWSTDNILQPRQVFKHSGIKYSFDCDDCHHIFQASLAHVNSENGVLFVQIKNYAIVMTVKHALIKALQVI